MRLRCTDGMRNVQTISKAVKQIQIEPAGSYGHPNGEKTTFTTCKTLQNELPWLNNRLALHVDYSLYFIKKAWEAPFFIYRGHLWWMALAWDDNERHES